MITNDELRVKYPRLIPPKFRFECYEGWVGILDNYFSVVDRELPPDATYELRQVKEKLGALRIYSSTSDADDDYERAVGHARLLAEARSYHVCEICGAPGRWGNRRGYLTTVCDEHAVRDGYRAEPSEPDEGYVYRDEIGKLRRYNPELDQFVETEVPEWARPH